MTGKVNNPNAFQKGERIQWAGETRPNPERVPTGREFTLVTDVDFHGEVCATWVDQHGNMRNSKLNVSKRGRYKRPEPQTMHQHLYRNPTHMIEVTNSGMPAEFILAICVKPGCNWESQW